MKTTDIGFKRFEEDFYAIPGTMFIENMRDATPEEQKSVQEYIDKISKPTGVNFYDVIDVNSSSHCDSCSNNTKNGGSGHCCCSLGLQSKTIC